MALKKFNKSVIALSLILPFLTSCASGSPVIDTYCAYYNPVYTSVKDTEQTKKDVDENNAIWLKRCTN